MAWPISAENNNKLYVLLTEKNMTFLGSLGLFTKWFVLSLCRIMKIEKNQQYLFLGVPLANWGSSLFFFTRWHPLWLGSNIILTPYSSFGNTFGLCTTQIAIFIGELYFMQPVTLQVKHLILFPGIEHIKIQ
jgi:hypothetical protein